MNTCLRFGISFVALCSYLTITGCSTGEPEDIKEWMKASAAGLKGRVPELPQIQPLPEILYDPGSLIQPFALEKLFSDNSIAAKALANGGGVPINPDAHPLTKAPLDSYRMIGTLQIRDQMVALLATDRENPRQVRVGDLIGQNFGKVIAIRKQTEKSDGEVVVNEKVLEKGVWVERVSRITQPIQGENQ